MTRRRWIAHSWEDATATLTGEQATHLARVLRAQAGMEFDLVAGDKVWQAVIAEILPDEVRFSLIAEVEAAPALPLTLLLAVFKFDRLEWAIEKATELGVARILPVIARRSEKHLAQAAQARVERWRRIALEAAKQSRRSDVPAIDDPVAFKLAVKDGADDTRLLLSEQERTTTLRAAIERALLTGAASLPALRIAVGPEGGWAQDEEQLFQEEGWTAVTLGPRILRAETAAMTAAAVAAALYL